MQRFELLTNEITACGSDVSCIEVKRNNVSGVLPVSNFRIPGRLPLANEAAFGLNAPGSPAPVFYGQFEKDLQQLQTNLVFGTPI